MEQFLTRTQAQTTVKKREKRVETGPKRRPLALFLIHRRATKARTGKERAALTSHRPQGGKSPLMRTASSCGCFEAEKNARQLTRAGIRPPEARLNSTTRPKTGSNPTKKILGRVTRDGRNSRAAAWRIDRRELFPALWGIVRNLIDPVKLFGQFFLTTGKTGKLFGDSAFSGHRRPGQRTT